MCHAASTLLLLREMNFRKICFGQTSKEETKCKNVYSLKKRGLLLSNISHYYIPLSFCYSLGFEGISYFFGNDRVGNVVLPTLFYSHQKVNGFFLESNEQQLALHVPRPLLPAEDHHRLWLCAEARYGVKTII